MRCCLASLDSNLNAASHLHDCAIFEITVSELKESDLFSGGGSCRIRTCDQLIKSQLLYRLS